MQSAGVAIQSSSFIDVQGSRFPDQSGASTSRSTGNGPSPDHNGQTSQGSRADPVAGLSFAQRLYASALAATKQENAPSTDKQTISTSTSPNDPIPDRVSTNSPPTLSMAALSLNSDSDITSLGSGRSLYKGVTEQTHSPSYTPQPPSHRTRSLPLSSPHISSLENRSQVNVHRNSTMPITTPASFVKPYTYTPPSETPHRVLVARPPVKTSHSHHSNAGTTTLWASGQPNVASQPLLPHKPSPIRYSSFSQYTSPLSSVPSDQNPSNITTPPAPPPQTLPTTYTQSQYVTSLPPPPQTPLTPPLTPPAKPYINKNPLATALGKAALRIVGKAVFGSIFDAVSPDSLFSGIAGSVLDAGTLDTLTNSLANLNLNDAGLDSAQLQAAFMGAPGTDYQNVINAILQQQQTAASPQVDYQTILDALRKIQQAQTTSNISGSLGHGGLSSTVPTQNVANAQNQHIQGLMAAIQQQAAQNAQLIQQQMQHIQNSAQIDATQQVQGILQAAYDQQIAMNSSAGASPQPQPQQTFQPLQHQHTVSLGTVPSQQQHTAPQQTFHPVHQHQQTSSTGSIHPQQQQNVVQQPFHPVHQHQQVSPTGSVYPHHQQNHPSQQHVTHYNHQNQHQPPRPTLNHHQSTPHLQTSSVHAPYQTSNPSNPPQQQPPRPTTYQQPPRPGSLQSQPPRPTSMQQPPRPPLQQQQQHIYQQPQQQPQSQPNAYHQPQQQPPSSNYQQPQQPETQPLNHQQYESPQSNFNQDPVYTQDPQSYVTPYDSSNYSSPEQVPGYALTPADSTADASSPPSFTSLINNAFDIGNQLFNNASSSNGDAPVPAASGYTLTDQSGGGGGESSGFNSLFQGVFSGSVDVGGNNFDFSAAISGGGESASVPEYTC